MKHKLVLLTLLTGLVTPLPALAQTEAEAPACRATDTSRVLDFWVGNFDVVSNDENREFYGDNLIEDTLDGCAIIEHWSSREGGQGKSLFYFDATANTWTQVWVTTDTSQPWGLKVKHLVNEFENGAVRFQSRQNTTDGKGYFDRTTLTPMKDGVLRQHIEISHDGGNTWQTTFDALYVPKGE